MQSMQTIVSRWRRYGGAAMVLAVGAGCSVTGPGQVARDWSCKIREMQIQPVFPPREDMHVGDVYWIAGEPGSTGQGYCGRSAEKDGFLAIPNHVTYFPEIMASVAAHYRGRPDFPAQVASTPARAASGTQAFEAVADLPTKTDIFTTGATNRTRLVAFPDFLTVEVNKASIGALLPLQGGLTGLGFSLEDVQRATISVPTAESYGVPVAQALGSIQAQAAAGQQCRALMQFRQGATGHGQLHMLTEVFYARAIDISIESKRDAGLALDRDRDVGALAPQAPASQAVAAQPPASAPSAAAALLAMAERATQAGVSANFSHGSVASTSIRRTFPRPVAIGFRAVVLDPRTVNNGGVEVCQYVVGTTSNVVAPAAGGPGVQVPAERPKGP